MKVYNVGRRTYTVGKDLDIEPGIATEVSKAMGEYLLKTYPKDIKTMDGAKQSGKSRREKDLDRREKELAQREKELNKKPGPKKQEAE